MIKTDWLKDTSTCWEWPIKGPSQYKEDNELDILTKRKMRKKVVGKRQYQKRKHNAYRRLFMEEMLGRKLRPDEDVHHINGDHMDDRPENMTVMKHDEHFLFHAKHPRTKLKN